MSSSSTQTHLLPTGLLGTSPLSSPLSSQAKTKLEFRFLKKWKQFQAPVLLSAPFNPCLSIPTVPLLTGLLLWLSLFPVPFQLTQSFLSLYPTYLTQWIKSKSAQFTFKSIIVTLLDKWCSGSTKFESSKLIPLSSTRVYTSQFIVSLILSTKLRLNITSLLLQIKSTNLSMLSILLSPKQSIFTEKLLLPIALI